MKYDLTEAKGYREGIVSKLVLEWNCKVPNESDDIFFRYIEVFFEGDERIFFYEDENAFSYFEENFHSKRFTSYHPFWTTKELAVEKRDFFELKYFVRRDNSCYIKINLQQIREMLENKTKYNAYVTKLGNYSRVVDDSIEKNA